MIDPEAYDEKTYVFLDEMGRTARTLQFVTTDDGSCYLCNTVKDQNGDIGLTNAVEVIASTVNREGVCRWMQIYNIGRLKDFTLSSMGMRVRDLNVSEEKMIEDALYAMGRAWKLKDAYVTNDIFARLTRAENYNE